MAVTNAPAKPRSTNSMAALVELVNESRRQTDQLERIGADSRAIRLKLAHHALIAASIAAFLGALWAAIFLIGTEAPVVSFNSSTPEQSFFDYIAGTPSISLMMQNDMLAIFLIRFLLAFGGLWFPLTLAIAAIDFARQVMLRATNR